MAPTTPGNSRRRQRELRVAKNSEGAQAQGGPLSNNTDRNSISIDLTIRHRGVELFQVNCNETL